MYNDNDMIIIGTFDVSPLLKVAVHDLFSAYAGPEEMLTDTY